MERSTWGIYSRGSGTAVGIIASSAEARPAHGMGERSHLVPPTPSSPRPGAKLATWRAEETGGRGRRLRPDCL